ncbi:ubiquitin-like-conjugating enzyme ATG10 [Stylophora pistillata]|uniref:Ubiquitin-like-conjugating enzyme ATG10 n=1 Tax=Stylophora pistillata TaxID=50429 RepID=A0A2B4SUC1_STYPI|nr:ubiquitin-like-conjugating enzyme ATG10 [Stylophora pistillata]XP_022779722.1 ubiquitin-like-conjugating enzyme ATG10 [Stylophora pistillata]XP_022779723.1 ubiquitin-like-conjugating enzyme ATG10 [Stylophora pistillata]PFX32178.1 Ubiquitin-like-conjugating enzyme ATG10 [Stylophora pistillata]
MWNTGTLSYEEFENELFDFLERARKVRDSWNLECTKGKRKVKYLTKNQVQLGFDKASEVGTEETCTEEMKWGVEEDDNDSVTSGQLESDINKTFLKYEYHVIYSTSYGVPVLYFTASRQDGKLVSLEEVWKSVPDVYHERLEFEKWTLLTQQEHPHLGVPFYQLHPCHTADMMKKIASVAEEQENHVSNANYLVTWLSTVGPIVGLKIPPEYST